MRSSSSSSKQVAIQVPLGGLSKALKQSDIENENNSTSALDEHDDRSDQHENSNLGHSSGGSISATSMTLLRNHSTVVLTTLILFLGMATSAAFLGIGLSGALESQSDDFERSAMDTVNKISLAFEDYVNAASLVHARCRHRDFTRSAFRELYEYITASGLQFKAVQFDPNITHAERPAAEAEAREFYAENYPHLDYQGFRGFNTEESTSLEPRTNQSFYFPIHYQEPVLGNEAATDLDYYSSEIRKRAVYSLFERKAPSLTDRLSLVKKAGERSRCGDHDGPSYGVVLMHPGVELTEATDVWPRDFSSIVLCIPDLLARSTSGQSQSSDIYIHDRSHPSGEPVFLGAAKVTVVEGQEEPSITFLDELPFANLEEKFKKFQQSDVFAANRIWTVTVGDTEGRWETSLLFVVLGGFIILLASIFLVVWIRTSDRRTRKFNGMRSIANSEKSALILQNARQATKAEREMNDFIAHEVRNPVAAAMAACNFVKIELHKPKPLLDQEALDQTKEDVNIIENALRFVNDLLRNMLDMHRAANKQLQVTMAPVELLHDVLEPAAGMLYRRGSKVKLIVECPESIFVMADCLRLKQVVLNLGRNSSKFVDEGFIRLRAVLINGNVKIYVDDSGCGIPEEKQKNLFRKFQESLDALSQGTGIGLFLCKNLVELMGGEIYLDESYDSGIEGHPGTRFVVDLKAGPIDPPQLTSITHHDSIRDLEQTMDATEPTNQTDDDMNSLPAELPDTLSVLFVDDDRVLRKLFTRAIKNVCPRWTIREAANGETALQLVEEGETFDVIFIDMYMASVEKQLLGTEAVAALRNIAFTNRICGLSANDKEQEFYDAGADAFMLKPFPCDEYAMTQQLCRVLYQDRNTNFENIGFIDEF